MPPLPLSSSSASMSTAALAAGAAAAATATAATATDGATPTATAVDSVPLELIDEFGRGFLELLNEFASRPAQCVVYSTDSELVAACSGQENSCVRVFDRNSGTLRWSAPHIVHQIVFSPLEDGHTRIDIGAVRPNSNTNNNHNDNANNSSSSSNNNSNNNNNHTSKNSITSIDSIARMGNSRSSQYIAAACQDSVVRVFDAVKGGMLSAAMLMGHTDVVYGVAWSRKNIIASASKDRSVRLWRPHDGSCIRILHGHTNEVYAIAFTPDGTQLATGGADCTIRFWDMTAGKYERTILGHSQAVWRIEFSPEDGSVFASSSRDETIRVWDTVTGVCLHIFNGLSYNGNGASTISWSPNGYFLASADCFHLRVFSIDISNPDGYQCVLAQPMEAYSAAFSPKGDEILTGNNEGKLMRWKSRFNSSNFIGTKDIQLGRLPISKLKKKLNADDRSIRATLDDLIQKMTRTRAVFPSAFHDQINLLVEINNPVFANVEKRNKKSVDVVQEMTEVAGVGKKMMEAAMAIRNHAVNQVSLDAVKSDVQAFETAVKTLTSTLQIATSNLEEYEKLVKASTLVSSSSSSSSSTSSSSSSSSSNPPSPSSISFPNLPSPSPTHPVAPKQYHHANPRNMTSEQLIKVMNESFEKASKLANLEKDVLNCSRALTTALARYEAECKSLRDPSEKTVDSLTAFLAYLTKDNDDGAKIQHFKTDLDDLKSQLGTSMGMSESFWALLDEYSNVHKKIIQIEQNRIELTTQKSRLKVHFATKDQYSKLEGPDDFAMLDFLDGLINKVTKKIQQLHKQVAEDAVHFPGLQQRLKDVKDSIMASKDIKDRPEIIYSWLNKNELHSNLTIKDIFELLGNAEPQVAANLGKNKDEPVVNDSESDADHLDRAVVE